MEYIYVKELQKMHTNMDVICDTQIEIIMKDVVNHLKYIDINFKLNKYNNKYITMSPLYLGKTEMPLILILTCTLLGHCQKEKP